MTKITKTLAADAANTVTPPTKNQQVIDLLARVDGASLEEMSDLAKWQPHSTRAFMTRLKNKGHVIDNEKVDGVRRYRIASSPAV
jgi:Protein of unknown function (DUF3489)